MGAAQTFLTIQGIQGLHVRATSANLSSSTLPTIPLVISTARLGPGTYTAAILTSPGSDQLVSGDHKADLVGVYVFSPL